MESRAIGERARRETVDRSPVHHPTHLHARFVRVDHWFFHCRDFTRDFTTWKRAWPGCERGVSQAEPKRASHEPE